MRLKKKLVCGVGINDADYSVYEYESIGGKIQLVWRCPFYKLWTGMLRRAYSPKMHAKCPTYQNCTISDDWHVFSSFRSWAITQPWEGNQLDKDILKPGNKVYSAETCIFIPQNLNTFLTDHGAKRGEHPIGVYLQKSDGKYKARCSNPFSGEYEYLGMYTDANDGHEAWRKRKNEISCKYADMQSDQRIADALRKRYASQEHPQ